MMQTPVKEVFTLTGVDPITAPEEKKWYSANMGHIHTCWSSLWSDFCTTGRPSCPHRGRPLVLFYPPEIKVTMLRWSRPYVRFPPIAQLICFEHKNENESHEGRPDHLSGRSQWSRCRLSRPLVGSVSTRTRIWQIQRGGPKFCLCENTLNFCKFKQQKAQVVLSVHQNWCVSTVDTSDRRAWGTPERILIFLSRMEPLLFLFSGANLSTL